jgi:hypothetical protein
MRLTPEQVYLQNLEGEIPVHIPIPHYSREEAHQELVEMTGQDFGYDVEAWKQWFKENRRKKNRKK